MTSFIEHHEQQAPSSVAIMLRKTGFKNTNLRNSFISVFISCTYMHITKKLLK